MEKLIVEVENLIENELKRANKEHPLFRSFHEALAVTEEEVYESCEDMKAMINTFSELKLSIFNDYFGPEYAVKLEYHALELACEVIQVAAMARKFNMREEEENERSNTDR